ncbi:Calvin cycle protein CP12-2 [Hibiscus syriacus]|uniref:Calvin cycle protein CP12-2 n=1 Tax=Hibiscus syriacus TaxID=106335 RepID=A0A6A2XZW7_HIBSY|nr:calvin cycle protein CP12-1, chloroplastic-like [Hibiscus syriacus]KAE8660574.1 Calvin cycle protein CP12-2 [Hibiscus syriacus]
MTMATLSSLNLATPRMTANLPDSNKVNTVKAPYLNQNRPWKMVTHLGSRRMRAMVPVKAAPDSLSEKVEQSIKEAQEACSNDPASGECVAAWDEVEELSAAASHARDRMKDNDPLENYCKDNPETDECKTYDN